jgi:glycosyltransferase involved in cell wall biosynthesis
MKIIIDASSKGSGGGKRHLKEILNEFINPVHKINKIFIWGPKSLLNILPTSPLIKKNTSIFLNKGLLGTIIWQLIFRDRDFKKINFDCIYSPFGNYTGKLKPYVTMSRNMLMFEEKERKKYGFSFDRLKLKLLYYVQKKSFTESSGVIFLSDYAKKSISDLLKNKFESSVVINHGVSNTFRKFPKSQYPISKYSTTNPFELLYVSNILPYKYHLNVINAVNQLVTEGVPIKLTLIGKNEFYKIGKKVNKLVNEVNIDNKIIDWYQNVSIDEVKKYYHQSDCFIFASTCENMPNILIEAMSSGLPIICSNTGPMEEFLKESGIYFNPLSVLDLKKSILKMINDVELRKKLSRNSYKLSFNYSWEKCAQKSISFIMNNSNNLKNV